MGSSSGGFPPEVMLAMGFLVLIAGITSMTWQLSQNKKRKNAKPNGSSVPSGFKFTVPPLKAIIGGVVILALCVVGGVGYTAYRNAVDRSSAQIALDTMQITDEGPDADLMGKCSESIAGDNTYTDQRLLVAWSKCDDWATRVALAKNSSAGPGVLARLALDPNEMVRSTVAQRLDGQCVSGAVNHSVSGTIWRNPKPRSGEINWFAFLPGCEVVGLDIDDGELAEDNRFNFVWTDNWDQVGRNITETISGGGVTVTFEFQISADGQTLDQPELNRSFVRSTLEEFEAAAG